MALGGVGLALLLRTLPRLDRGRAVSRPVAGQRSFSFAFPELPPCSRQRRSPFSTCCLPCGRLPGVGHHIWEQPSLLKHKKEYKHLKTPEPKRMDFSKGAEAAAYNEKSETDIFGENYSWQIPINHNDFKILKNNESQLCEVLQNKFGCISTLVSPAWEGNSKSLQVFRKRLTPWLELSVWKADLTRHPVDAVVNAANEDLIHGGGLACALVKAGGQEIQKESTALVSRFGKIPTGEIAFTGAGRLPCKVIIHAVGPRWAEMHRECCIFQLQKAIVNILNYVTSARPPIETVAIPAVSSGIFQFPLHLCTQIIVETIRKYFQGMQLTGTLKQIHLVSNEDPTVAAFKAASESILGKNELGSQVSQGAILPLSTMVVNNLTVQIVQGLIYLQKTDVIVGLANPNLGDRVGPVSESIPPKAGNKIEEKFTKKSLQTSKDPQLVLVTDNSELPGQYVFHVCWPSEYSRRDLILRNIVKKCLENCLELNLTSISLPALGTGNAGLGNYEVAEIMFDEVFMFAKQPLAKQLTVKFVICPEEQETYKAFNTVMQRSRSKQQPLNSYTVPQGTRGTRETREHGLKANSPAINLMGSNLEKMCEAEEWIQRILTHQDQHTIENNHILYLGKEEHDILAQHQAASKVSVLEIIKPGQAILEIKGAQADLVEVVLKIEQMLCEVQEKMARKKEQALWNSSRQWTDQQPKHQDEMKENKFLKCLMLSSQEIQDQKKQFENNGLQIIKVEKIDNVDLMAAFQRKKKVMEGRMHRKPVSHRLFQQVPQQFCEVVCRVGFQRLYSMPCDPKYGAGIYFTKTLRSLADQIKKTPTTDKLIYVFEAEVLTGSFCQGHQLNIVPPPLSPGDVDRHDSVVDNVSSPETFVVFSGMQAMPLYLWTCTQNPVRPWNYSSALMMQSSQSHWEKFVRSSSVD
ncbi:protein mono-ADP-ribosyltransferase PARP9 isoform X2 [Sturnira hondurensis]|uniref:protein mono-ADP-ribosyltransferase PARP9 isoform X2 n=1 Tax=Sturnira hondurensis TaxID=192404 RepID=UPI001879678B|nr:protein mono-ADP-ribosyltransferase PARP9 isoform X2 [Sturnira hondurensis]